MWRTSCPGGSRGLTAFNGTGTVRSTEPDGETRLRPCALSRVIQGVMCWMCSPDCPLYRPPVTLSRSNGKKQLVFFLAERYLLRLHLGQVIASFFLLSAEVISLFSRCPSCSPWAKPGWRLGRERCPGLFSARGTGIGCTLCTDSLKPAVLGHSCVGWDVPRLNYKSSGKAQLSSSCLQPEPDLT